MTDLIKGVVGGGWSLLVGWILPAFLSLQLIALLLLDPDTSHDVTRHWRVLSWSDQQIALLALAAVVGLVLAAVKNPLYKPLEGYALWPPALAERAVRRHVARREALVVRAERVRNSSNPLAYGLAYQRLARYPAADGQFAPTMLGNGIRRLETYASDRYRMDSQLLWYHLQNSASDRTVSAVDNAQTNVDFFVGLIYGSVLLGGASVAAIFALHIRVAFCVAGLLLGIVLCLLAYRLAIVATDEWELATRAMVDEGKAGVAAMFGLTVPAALTDERLMWQAVCTFVRRPFAYSADKDIEALLLRFRREPVQEQAAQAGARSRRPSGHGQ